MCMWLTRGGCIWEVPTRGLWLGKIWCFRSVITYGRWSLARGGHTWIRLDYKVEPRHNKAPRDWQNLFAIMRFRYIEVLFHKFFYYWGKENRFLYCSPCYTDVCYIAVRLYYYHKNCIPVSCFGIKASCPEKP